MKQHIVRQYDIRGIVGQDFSLDDTTDLIHAWLYDLYQQKVPSQRLVIGYDGRVHSQAIMQKVQEITLFAGHDVINIGLVPTPLVYYVLASGHADIGIMITASHNGPEYNGFKLCVGKLPYAGADLQRLLSACQKKVRVPSKEGGSCRFYNAIKDYTADMRKRFPDIDGQALPVVIDAGHGATGPVLTEWVQCGFIKPKALVLAEVDGTWPVHGPDPVDKANTRYLASHITKHTAAYGVAFDGDGDRMIALDEDGINCSGDKLLALWSAHIAQTQPAATIVCDSKSSILVEIQAQHHGLNVVRAPAGHTHIKKAMREHNAVLGGELSCHFFFADEYHGYDDALYAFLRLARFLYKTQKTLKHLLSELPRTYEIDEYRIACFEEEKIPAMAKIQEYITSALLPDGRSRDIAYYDGIRVATPHGWWLVRPSHTQSVLCARAEGIDPEALDAVRHEMKQALMYAEVKVPATL